MIKKRVLFVCSGNSVWGISPIVKRQADSLIQLGLDVEYFTIDGKGVVSYIVAIFNLRRLLRKSTFQAVHAHYSFSGFVATLAGAKFIVTSLMGSDVTEGYLYSRLIELLSKYSWKNTIVKSEVMLRNIKLRNSVVIPNGVDLKKFKQVSQELCQSKLKWDSKKRHVLFAANPNRPEKNFALAIEAFQMLNESSIVLHSLRNVKPDDVQIYMNASDLVILLSSREGSPNVIKEAMACNKQILATNVGDIKEIIGNVEGCMVVDSHSKKIAAGIKELLSGREGEIRTNGRKIIINKGLDSVSIAKRISQLYFNN